MMTLVASPHRLLVVTALKMMMVGVPRCAQASPSWSRKMLAFPWYSPHECGDEDEDDEYQRHGYQNEDGTQSQNAQQC